MRKIAAWIMMLFLLLTGISCALAQGGESGVTILNVPTKVDLYIAHENVFYSGSIRYKLDEGAVVTKHSITQYQNAVGFEMSLHDEGNGVYRMDLRGMYDHMALEILGLPDTLPFTFTVETKAGLESASFPVNLHAESWDARRVVMDEYRDDAAIGDEIVVLKPTLDGAIVPTGLLNDSIHLTDPYFGSGWVNDISYTADTLQLVSETNNAFIFKAIAPGNAETICTVREINSNRSISVCNSSFTVTSGDTTVPSAITFDCPPNLEARFTLQDGRYESDQILTLVHDPSSDSQILDASQLSYRAYILDTDIISGLDIIDFRPSNSRQAIVLRYALSNAKKAGVTQLVVNMTYKGADYSLIIPIIICDETTENDPYTPDVAFDFPKIWYRGDVPAFQISGKDAELYTWDIECAALGLRGVTGQTGIYPVYANMYSPQMGNATLNLGTVTVKERDAQDPTNDRIFMDETWSNFNFGPAFCSEIDDALELELGAYGCCLSDAQNHDPQLTCELIGVAQNCPYEIAVRECGISGNHKQNTYALSPYAWVTMTPKTAPLTPGRYPYQVKYTVTCCGQTASIIQSIPVMVVDIPENKLDYLHTPPAYMCLDRDEILWDNDILTPINRYCGLDLIFESGAEVWKEMYYQRFRLYRPTEEGLATWRYVGTYANGEIVLHSGETMIFTREEYAQLNPDTNLTAVRNNFDLTPEQRDVPRLFPANANWSEEWFLKSQTIDTNAENSICYELKLVDEYENEVALPESTTLYLPYPNDMTAEEAADCEFVIIHEAKDGTQVYSTQEGTITRTQYGLEITVDSLSPFTINWGTEEEMNALLASHVDTGMLPQTGDNSKIALWLALLTLSGAAMLVFRRRAA